MPVSVEWQGALHHPARHNTLEVHDSGLCVIMPSHTLSIEVLPTLFDSPAQGTSIAVTLGPRAPVDDRPRLASANIEADEDGWTEDIRNFQKVGIRQSAELMGGPGVLVCLKHLAPPICG